MPTTLRPATLLAFLALVVAAPTAAAAPATCVSATPATATLLDAIDDAEPGAPEVTAIRANINADCTVSVRLSVANRTALRTDDALLIYFDTDANRSTGAPSFGGADRGVGLVTDEDGPGYLALLGRWDTGLASIDFESAVELDVSADATGYGFTAGIDDLGVRSGTSLGISIASLSEPDGEIRLDFAPDDEGNAFALPLAYTTTADAGAGRTTAPTPTPSTGTARRDSGVRATCVVPKKMRGRTLAAARRALRAAGCRPGRVRARHGTAVRTGRVTGTLPGGGKRVAASRPITLLVAHA